MSILELQPVIVPVFLPLRGCPGRCLFCNQEHTSGRKVGSDAEKQLRRGMEIIRRSPKAADRPVQIAFYGGNFTGIELGEQAELLALAGRYIRQRRAQSIRISTRPDFIDAEAVAFLKERQVSVIELGVQSLVDRVLEASNRRHTAVEVSRAVAEIRGQGLSVGMQLMIGLPEDTEETRAQTLAAAVRLAPDFLRLNPTLVLSGSGLARLYHEGGYRPLGLEQAVDICARWLPVLENAGLKIIRIGLQPTDPMLNGSAVVAGPFHPSFRHLVDDELFWRMIKILCDKLSDAGPNERPVNISCHPRDVSNLRGLAKSNLGRIARHFPDWDVNLRTADDLARHQLRVECGRYLRTISYRQLPSGNARQIMEVQGAA